MNTRESEQPVLRQPDLDDVPTQHLVFDTENPRLTVGREIKADEDMIRTFWHEMAVDEIVDSISANGFFREEPLIVIPKDPRKSNRQEDMFVVVEGNRRLAAVRLLLDKDLRKRIGAKDIPEIGQELRDDLRTLPVAIYEKRAYVWAYLVS